MREYFAAADRWDFAAFPDYLSPTLRFRLANNAPIEGLGEMIALAGRHKEAVKSVQHTLDRFAYDTDRRRVAVELTVSYVRHDDVKKSYPAAVVLDFDTDDLISGYRVFVDLSDLPN
ncbi:hypothetical protein AWC23_06420 [Mycobacterium saskatchewanense]|uniref:SnoaL-like domain-containing protein n=1 Tax=Mycobacterium saskatchewanense TaxID=220927 RepID=A0AAJ3TWC9_9MYCO|nr:hypothetical protein AWC23_06420 [Mycobacterium saskatchewanense]